MHFLLYVLLFMAPHSVTTRWLPSKEPGTVYYNVYRDLAGTQKYVKLNPSPLLCAQVVVSGVTWCQYYDDTVAAGATYDYEATSWMPVGATGLESPLSLTAGKSGNVTIP